MKSILLSAVALTAAVTLSGCYTTGLSFRETGAVNFTSYVYSLYGQVPTSGQKVHYVRKPIKLAVAQVGEVTPQNSFLEALSQQSRLIYSITTVPAGNLMFPQPYAGPDKFAQPDRAELMNKMRYLAKDQGADYLFLFGGSTDFQTTPNFLQFFDITLIGAYILPSAQHNAEGRAAGALIDVHSGQVILIANADAEVSRTTPSYLNYYERNNAVFMELREELIEQLSRDFIDKLNTFNQ